MINKRGYAYDRNHFGTPLVPTVEGKYVDYDDGIPDLAFVPLAAKVVADLTSRNKSFYRLDARREDPDLYGDGGYWLAVGTPRVLARETPESAHVTTFVYSTGVGNAENVFNWDLIPVNLDLHANPELPENYRGVSGGALWRARIYVREADGEVFTNPAKDVILSGVLFLQTPMNPRRLIAHGPRSIYERLYGAVRR